ncbi:MAG: family 20 glycosylhydrolase [Sphaerochaeta sp.]|nr:family 20 glycosylhydrolase [Sphaerochaeta sp.]
MLVPYPNGEVTQSPELLVLGNNLSIERADAPFAFASAQVQSWLAEKCHLAPSLVEPGQEPTVRFRKSTKKLSDEGYAIYVSSQGCILEASSEAGAFYAVQTFKQLIDPIQGTIPCCEIHDSPSFLWRGLLLDATRSFCPLPEMYRLIDLSSSLKLNVLHWHLTDDQGWRIAIDAYPQLTDASPEFYSKEDVRAALSYARERNITIIPEIDMPGHFVAALAHYPQFSCTGGPFSIPQGEGIFSELLCLGKDEALLFAERIIGEVCDLFPAPFIHLGGDEIPLIRWKECPDCQKRMQELALKNEKDLLCWFANSMAQVARKKGKTVILWNDSIDDQYDPSIVCQVWNPLKNGSDQVGDRPLIMSHYFHTYLNLPHSVIPTRAVYQYGVILNEDAKRRSFMMGSEFLLWTEHIHTRKERDKHLFPRLGAGSETLWTDPSRLDWKRFSHSFAKCNERLFTSGVTRTHSLFANPPRVYCMFRRYLKHQRVRYNSRKSGIAK